MLALSYLILLFIIVSFLSIAVYHQLALNMEEKVNEYRISLTQQFAKQMELWIKNMNALTVEISMDPALTPYFVRNGGYSALQATRQLIRYKKSNSFLCEVALFFPEYPSKIYTSGGACEIDVFFKYHYKYNNWTSEEFLKEVERMESLSIHSLEEVEIRGMGLYEIITFMYPLPSQTSAKYCIVVMLMQTEFLKDIFESFAESEGVFAIILDKNGRTVFQYNNSEYIPFNSNDFMNAITSSDTVNYEGNQYNITRLVSNESDWIYIVGIQDGCIEKKLFTNIWPLVSSFIVVLALGFILAVALAIKNYLPLRELAQKLRTNNVIMPEKINDELKFISESVNQMLSENRSLMSQLKSNVRLARDQVLLILLKKSFDNEDEPIRLLKNADIDFSGESYSVLLITRNTKQYEAFPENVWGFNVINILEELTADIGNSYAMEIPGESIVALILCLDKSNFKEKVRFIAKRIQEIFNQYFQENLIIGAGCIYDRINMLHCSYLEARKSLFYKMVINDSINNELFYDEIEKSLKQANFIYPYQQVNKLATAIKQGNMVNIKNITKEISHILENSEIAPVTVQCIYFGIINMLLRVLDEMELELEKKLIEDIQKFTDLARTPLKPMQNEIYDLCASVSEYIQKNKKGKNDLLQNKLIQYIHEHIYDPNLSVGSMACDMNLSASYISRFFKFQTGYTISNYIDNLRLDKAKKLLKETELSLKEILDSIGYVDPTNFIRKFKKSEGLTPMQYRIYARNNEMSKTGENQTAKMTYEMKLNQLL